MSAHQKSIIKYVPNGLAVLRCLIAPFLVFDALDGAISAWFVPAFLVAAISDLIDGPIARRFNAVTALGSKLDSYGDVVLIGTALFCIWRVHPEVIARFWIPLVTVGFTQVSSWVISIARFGRMTCYHSYVAKVWALIIFIAIVSLFAFNYAGIFFWLAVIVGIVSNLEDIAITLILPRYSCDVLTIGEALKLRRQS